jgi:hypothetical protein
MQLLILLPARPDTFLLNFVDHLIHYELGDIWGVASVFLAMFLAAFLRSRARWWKFDRRLNLVGFLKCVDRRFGRLGPQ